MTKAGKTKKDVKFQHRERRLSSSVGDMGESHYESPNDDRSSSRSTGAKSPTRNGVHARHPKDAERPTKMERTDTTASGWATENEDEKVGRVYQPHIDKYAC